MGKRALLLPESRGHVYSDWRLRESLARHGVLQPVLYWRNQLIDGVRRERFAETLSLEVPRVTVQSPRDAAALLWAHHPRRAYELFARACCGKRPRHDALVRLFACHPTEIPTADQVRDASRERKRTDLQRLPSVSVSPTVLATAHAECKARGITLTDAVKGLVEYLGRTPPA